MAHTETRSMLAHVRCPSLMHKQRISVKNEIIIRKGTEIKWDQMSKLYGAIINVNILVCTKISYICESTAKLRKPHSVVSIFRVWHQTLHTQLSCWDNCNHVIWLYSLRWCPPIHRIAKTAGQFLCPLFRSKHETRKNAVLSSLPIGHLVWSVIESHATWL